MILDKAGQRVSNKGQSLIELLMIIGLSAIILPALITGLVTSRSGKAQQTQRLEAVALLREATEAVRNVREAGWDGFSINGTYHPEISGSTWVLVSGAETVNDFIRQIIITDVQRNSSGVIVASGGTVDPSTKQVVITVSWDTPLSSQVESTLYLTRYLENLTYTETTEEQFNAGETGGTTITNQSGGEITLGAGGSANWCAPVLSPNTLDLPKSGVANAITAIEGRAFAGTGENASGVSFANISISNSNPPVPTITGTYDCCKTNDIFGETNYAYLATDNNSKEIEIINLSSSPYSEAGYFNAPGNGNGNSVFVAGNIGYMTSGNKFYTFDLSSKSGSRGNPLGSVTLPATGNRIEVVGSYAYVALESTSTQLQIVDVSIPTNLSLAGTASVSGQAAKDVFTNSTGTRAYVATAQSASQKELFIIDVSTKTGSRPTIGSYEANGMSPKGVTVVTGNKAILVGTGAEEYQVIDIATESSPARCGGINIDVGINGLASILEQDGDAYSYIITGDASSEFKIIAGGPGGQYATEGTFESQTFDPQVETRYYNRFTATIAEPSQTDISLQLAVATEAADHTCNGITYTFVGPDTTSSTFFTSTNGTTIDGQIPPNDDDIGYENPARCLRYKVFMSTDDYTQTPVFYDITINYSP